VSNSTYRVQYKSDLRSTNWTDLSPDVVATGSTTSYTDHPGNAPQRFYRIELLANTAPAPVIQSIAMAGTNNVVITWTAVTNRTYRVQYKSRFSDTAWTDLGPDVTATNSMASFTDHPGGARQRFYRVGLLP
jgi:hypothetical protein